SVTDSEVNKCTSRCAIGHLLARGVSHPRTDHFGRKSRRPSADRIENEPADGTKSGRGGVRGAPLLGFSWARQAPAWRLWVGSPGLCLAAKSARLEPGVPRKITARS